MWELRETTRDGRRDDDRTRQVSLARRQAGAACWRRRRRRRAVEQSRAGCSAERCGAPALCRVRLPLLLAGLPLDSLLNLCGPSADSLHPRDCWVHGQHGAPAQPNLSQGQAAVGLKQSDLPGGFVYVLGPPTLRSGVDGRYDCRDVQREGYTRHTKVGRSSMALRRKSRS